MVEAIQEVFKNIFGNNVVLATLIISMLPIIELRGGIPFGMSKAFWGEYALSSWQSLGWSFLGSSLVVPFLALLFIPIMNWLKKMKAFKKLAIKIENRIKEKSNKISDENVAIETKNSIYDKKFFGKLVGVLAFVAIPLPLTGVWTGTAIAVMLGIPFIWICVTVILGNLIAGIIMQTICAIFPNFTTWILIIFLILTLILIIVSLIKNKLNKIKNNKRI